MAQHAATPVPPLLPPPLGDLNPTPNCSSGRTGRSGCQKRGAPASPNRPPGHTGTSARELLAGDPCKRGTGDAMRHQDSRPGQGNLEGAARERRGRGMVSRVPGTHRARGPRCTARATAAPAARRDAERASSRPPPAQIRMGSGFQPGAPLALSLSRALPCPRGSPSPRTPAAPPLQSAQPGRRPKFG